MAEEPVGLEQGSEPASPSSVAPRQLQCQGDEAQALVPADERARMRPSLQQAQELRAQQKQNPQRPPEQPDEDALLLQRLQAALEQEQRLEPHRLENFPEARSFSVEHSSHDSNPSACFYEPEDCDPQLPASRSPTSEADSENCRADRPLRVPVIQLQTMRQSPQASSRQQNQNIFEPHAG